MAENDIQPTPPQPVVADSGSVSGPVHGATPAPAAMDPRTTLNTVQRGELLDASQNDAKRHPKRRVALASE